MLNPNEMLHIYLNKGIIEAQMESAKLNDTPLSVVKFGFTFDADNGYFFKNVFHFIHTHSGFNSLLYHENDTFLLLLKETKIHAAKTLMKKIENGLRQKLKAEIKTIGITLFDANDTYKSLLDRLDKYYVMSKLSSRKKMFYGTLEFDFYETPHHNDLLSNILKKHQKATLHNFFNGIPIKEEIEMNRFENGIAYVHVSPSKIGFYAKEAFTFIQHERIPDVIKAHILKIDASKSLLTLSDLEFLDASPVERDDMRVEPEKPIHVLLLANKIRFCDSTLLNISESSIALRLHSIDIEKLLQHKTLEQEFEVEFHVSTEKQFLTKISLKGFIFSIVDEMVILTIEPTVFMKSKIKQYVALRQKSLLSSLKQHLKGAI